jgi:hypothetical protein
MIMPKASISLRTATMTPEMAKANGADNIHIKNKRRGHLKSSMKLTFDTGTL